MSKQTNRRPGESSDDTRNKPGPSPYRPQVILKYALFQVPELLLLVFVLCLADIWLRFGPWVWWVIVGFWIAKEIALYPFLWRSFDDRSQKHQYDPVGKQAVAVSDINPKGKVRLGSELWSARLLGQQEVKQGQSVRVVSREGLTLVVQAEGFNPSAGTLEPKH